MKIRSHVIFLISFILLMSSCSSAKMESIRVLRISDNVFNPNSFGVSTNNGLYLADLNTGINYVTTNGIEPVSKDISLDFRLPAAITLYNKKLYIADYRNNRIVVLDEKSYKKIDEWSHSEMSDPEGIASDDKGNIYVASYGNGKILKFTSEGKLIKVWSNASKDGQKKLIHPHGIFIDGNNLYITELAGDKSVIVYDLNGNFVQKFGHENEEWRLKYPTSLWVYNNTVIVADALSNQIKFFSKDGRFLRSIGEMGIDKGQFYYPYGVGVDNSGTIYVGDTHNHRIQFFTFGGKYLGTIANPIEMSNKLVNHVNRGISDLDVEYKLFDMVPGIDIETREDDIFLLDINDGLVKKYSNGEVSNIIENLNYPWSMSVDSNYIYINDDPGSLTMYSIDPVFTKIYMNMTSLQFDPVESLDAWIYRPQDVEATNNEIAIANTLPGNVVILDKYGGIQELIKWDNIVNDFKSSDSFSGRSMPTGLDFLNNGKKIVVVDMTGRVLVIDRDSHEAYYLKSPLDFYQPYKVNVNNVRGIIAITEPYADRIQFFDQNTLKWVGVISKNTISELIQPAGITTDEDGNMYVTSLNSKKVMKLTLNSEKLVNNGINPEKTSIKIEKNSNLNENSAFIRVYGGNIDKALNYWNYYKTDEGIVKYDFNFAWLNFKIPVAPGYGSHIWNTGIAHYALLNYYKWKETNNDNYKHEFLSHVNWIVKHAKKQKDGLVVWPNDITLTIKDVDKGYISSSAQAGIAATLIHAIEVDPSNKKKYEDMARGALKAFDLSIRDGGVVSWLNNRKFFVEYPITKVQQRYDIIPYMWSLVFLKETGSYGESYYNEAIRLIEDLKNNRITINNYPYWGEQFGDQITDLQTSKIVMKVLEALNIKLN